MAYEHSKIHLCYDCAKAEAGTCPIYEGITQIIDEHFDMAKVIFQVPECEYFLPQKSMKHKTSDI
jgi:hypothetical protein